MGLIGVPDTARAEMRQIALVPLQAEGRDPVTSGESPRLASRGDYFDSFLDQFLRLHRYAPNDRDAEWSRELFNFLPCHVFGFLKFFVAACREADPLNFYMECLLAEDGTEQGSRGIHRADASPKS